LRIKRIWPSNWSTNGLSHGIKYVGSTDPRLGLLLLNH
jgi:hypothetical protein